MNPRWNATDRAALREMINGGELYTYGEDAGVLCRHPPDPGSGVIVGDGRTAVSPRTIRRLSPLLTCEAVRKIRPERVLWAEMIADGLPVELPI